MRARPALVRATSGRAPRQHDARVGRQIAGEDGRSPPARGRGDGASSRARRPASEELEDAGSPPGGQQTQETAEGGLPSPARAHGSCRVCGPPAEPQAHRNVKGRRPRRAPGRTDGARRPGRRGRASSRRAGGAELGGRTARAVAIRSDARATSRVFSHYVGRPVSRAPPARHASGPWAPPAGRAGDGARETRSRSRRCRACRADRTSPRRASRASAPPGLRAVPPRARAP